MTENKNTYMCQYGDCVREDTNIIITMKGAFNERVRFCSKAHAIGWLQSRMERPTIEKIGQKEEQV